MAKTKIKKEKLPTDLVSFPVYMVRAKYDVFNELCKSKRMPMTRVAEAEIDKFLKRNATPELLGQAITD